MYAQVVSFGYIMCSDLYCFTISGDRTFCDWKFLIINFVITRPKYHKIVQLHKEFNAPSDTTYVISEAETNEDAMVYAALLPWQLHRWFSAIVV